jgi:hypothetical protein
MVIEFTQCVLSGFVDRSIFDRLFLGRGKQITFHLITVAYKKRNRIATVIELSVTHRVLAFLLFPAYIRYSTCVTLRRGRPSYPNPFWAF